jgi:creatinine amidohydrolase
MIAAAIALLLAVPAGSGVRVADLTWVEAERVLTPERVVVLPLGAAAKEHGPHLLLRNDQILADYFAERVRQARPVALLPTLTYAFYPAFLEYPGSVSLSHETQRDVVAQIVRSIARYGPRRFYVLNTGVSTARPLAETQELLRAEGIALAFSDVKVIGKAAEARVREQELGTHADEIETSMVLYIEPGAVRMDQAVADGLEDRPGPLTRDPKSATGHVSPSGVFGDARLATRAKGEAVVEQMVKDVLAEIDALSAAPVPAGSPKSPIGR